MIARFALALMPLSAIVAIGGLMIYSMMVLSRPPTTLPSSFVELPNKPNTIAPPASGGQQVGLGDTCNKNDWQDMVSKPLAGAQLPAQGPNFRVIRPGDQVTEEFNENRLNVAVDEKGIITDVRCG